MHGEARFFLECCIAFCIIILVFDAFFNGRNPRH